MNEEPTPQNNEAPSGPPLENLLGKRILAGLIDLIVIIVIGVIMTALFGDIGSDEDSDFNASLSGLPFLAYILIVFSYYFLMEAASGQTLGKRVLGIKVVSATGGRPSAGNVAIRTVLRIVDGFAFYIVGVIVIALSGKHQRIGDMAAGTVVVSAPKT